MDPPQNQRRKVLSQAVALMVQETGYESAEKVALESLTEMFQSGKKNILITQGQLKLKLNNYNFVLSANRDGKDNKNVYRTGWKS
jgi:hypothetical protein